MAARPDGLALAKRQLKELREARRRHRQHCRRCVTLRHDRFRWCDQGWELERLIRETDNLVDQLGTPAAGAATLF